MSQTINPRKQRAAIYARVSSAKQNEDGTIESQISILVDHAKKHDFEIPEGWIFQDNGVSGSTIQRPALDNLRDLIASGSADVVLIYHPDRLARKYVYQAILLDEFSKAGVEVNFYKNKKAETPEEHLLEQFQGIFAEYERAQITERCRRGRLFKAKQGSVTVLPNAPYGYRYVRDETTGLAHYDIHEDESKSVLKLFQMYSEGYNLSKLASYMNQSGNKPRRSESGWDRQTIRTMLRNRSYVGLASFCKTEKCEGNSQRIIRAPKAGRKQISTKARRILPEETWITIPIPAIVPENIYYLVQEKLNEAKRFASRNTKESSILQGVLVCGKCGGSYYKKSRKNTYTYYCCHRTLVKTEKTCDNRSIRQQDLDHHVWEWIMSILRDPKLVETEIERRLAENLDNKQITARKMSLHREQTQLVSSRNKLLDAYTEGACLSLEELKKRMHILNQKTQQIQRELSVIDSQTNDVEKIKESRLTLEKFAESLDNSSTSLSVEEKQKVIRALIHEIVIHENSINIRHCIPIEIDAKKKSKNCLLKEKRKHVAPCVSVGND